MKRILLFLTCVLTLFGVARAETVTFDFTSNGTNLKNGPIELVFSKGSGSSNPGYYDATSKLVAAMRCYANNTLKITSSGDNITKVSFSWGSTTTAGLSSSVGNYSDPNWTGDAKEITFTAGSSGQQHITGIEVTYGNDGGGGNIGGEVTPPVDPTPGGELGSYTIVFANNSTASDGSIYNSSTINNAIETGGEYVSAITGYTNAYPGKSGYGLKLGTGSNTGDFTFSLSEKGKVHATKLVFSAAAYNTGDKASLKVTLNGSKVFTEPLSTSHTNLEDFTFTIDEGIDLETIKFESTTKRANIKSITVYYGDDNSDKTPVTLSYDENTYTATKGEAFNAPKLNVTPEEAVNAVSYKTDNTNVATVDASGAITVKELGKTTVKAEISDNKTYANSSASYTLNVIKDGEYTVAEALTAIKNGYEGKARVKGIITSIDEISEQYKNATYNISDDAAGTNSLQVFRGKWLDGADFSGNEIQIGGTVVVEGDLTNYNGTLEVGTGNVVISYLPPVAQDFTGFEKYESEDIELEVGDELALDLGEKYPVITYNFDEEGIITITDNKVKALSEGTAIVTASWNADDNWTAGSAEFMVDVTAAQLGEIIATVSDGTELVNDGTITISEGTTITFFAKNAKQIVLITADDNVEDDEVNGDTLVWTPSLCEDEVVMVEAYMDPENTTSSATSYFEFTLTVTEKQYEKGTEQNPYTVTEFNENFSNITKNNVWVTGYIVGSRENSTNYLGQSDKHVNSNLLLSDDAEASSSSLCIPVALPTTKNIRADLNVKDNANNIGRQVKVFGTADTYFSMNGLRETSDYKFLDEKTPDPTPDLSFMFEGKNVEEPIELGWDATEFPILMAPADAEFDVTYTSSDTTVAEIDEDGNITLKGVAGETIITATTAAIEGQYAAGSVSYTLVILDPNSAKGMFNFTVENPYGMTTLSGTSSSYETATIIAKEEDVTLQFAGRFRSWLNNKGSYDLRVYSSGTEAGSLTFSVPAGYKLETIEFNTDGTDYTKLSPEVGTIKNGVWEPSEDVVTSVKFTATSNATIYTIDVYYTMLPAPEVTVLAGADETVQSGEIDNEGNTIKMYSQNDKVIVFITTPKGTTPWYAFENVTKTGVNSSDNQPGNGPEQMVRPRRLPADNDYQQAQVYDDSKNNPEYENNGQYYVELNNETTGTLHIIYKDENGQTVSSPATYSFEVVRTDPTGVETVVVGEGEVIFFDLNGRRVANPDKGIFIKVEADKVSKVIL